MSYYRHVSIFLKIQVNEYLRQVKYVTETVNYSKTIIKQLSAVLNTYKHFVTVISYIFKMSYSFNSLLRDLPVLL